MLVLPNKSCYHSTTDVVALREQPVAQSVERSMPKLEAFVVDIWELVRRMSSLADV